MAKRQKAVTEEMPFNGPGVAPVVIKEIDKAALKYVNVRDERMQLTTKECEARAKLIESVKAHADAIGKNDKGEIIYKFDDLVRSQDSPEDGDEE